MIANLEGEFTRVQKTMATRIYKENLTMGSPVRSQEVTLESIDANEMENAQNLGPEIINVETVPEDGVTVENMASTAQANLLANEQTLQPIRLPGNRKARRKLVKELKDIPKAMIMKCSKKESDRYTQACKENVISIDDFKEEIKVAKEEEKARRENHEEAEKARIKK